MQLSGHAYLLRRSNALAVIKRAHRGSLNRRFATPSRCSEVNGRRDLLPFPTGKACRRNVVLRALVQRVEREPVQSADVRPTPLSRFGNQPEREKLLLRLVERALTAPAAFSHRLPRRGQV